MAFITQFTTVCQQCGKKFKVYRSLLAPFPDVSHLLCYDCQHPDQTSHTELKNY